MDLAQRPILLPKGFSVEWLLEGIWPTGNPVPHGAAIPLDPDATYTVATNDFMRIGGDGYSVFHEKAINAYDGGSPLDVVLADYIKANSPVNPQVEGRITRVDKP